MVNPRTIWMEEVRAHCKELIRLISNARMDDTFKDIERDVGIHNFTKDLSMILIALNKRISRG